MRRQILAFAALALLASGCGSDDSADSAGATQPPATTAQPPAEKPEPASAPATLPKKAIKTIKQQAATAAGRLEGVSERDLLPSEKGADLLVDKGYVNADKFCAADAETLDAEATPEAEAAFEAGWESSAPSDLKSLGGAIYNALSTRCLSSG
jgi:hypothetical protein